MTLDLQKANMWKRISAFLFDFILMGVLAVGIGFLLSSALGYDGYMDTLTDAYSRYESQYGIKFEMTQDEYMNMTDEEQENYSLACDALTADDDAAAAYNMVVNETLLISSLSLLIAFLVWEFAIPLWLKNGQTPGKKIFGIGLMHTSGIEITPVLLFIRTVLGKYTIETMLPLLLIMMISFNIIGRAGTVILGILFISQLILIIVTPTNSPIHDLLAKTVAVDISSQRIFKNGAELVEYKKKLAAEEAERQPW